MFTTMTPAAIVSAAESARPAKAHRHVAEDLDPQVRDLQRRAECHVATLTAGQVEEYEWERVFEREELGLNPVPVTNRGLRILEECGYTVDNDGYLRI